ncbi:MAG: hypothetical protein ACOC2U_03485 [bacterium]
MLNGDELKNSIIDELKTVVMTTEDENGNEKTIKPFDSSDKKKQFDGDKTGLETIVDKIANKVIEKIVDNIDDTLKKRLDFLELDYNLLTAGLAAIGITATAAGSGQTNAASRASLKTLEVSKTKLLNGYK